MRLWNYLAGYVMIRVEGLSLEKFLNLAAQQGVVIAQVKRVSYTILHVCVSARGYKKLRAAVPEKYSISEQKKAGVPFGISRLIGRKVLLAGLILVTVSIFAASLFVFEVRVSGLGYNEMIALKEELADMGIYAGAHKGSIDIKEAERRLLIAHDEFAWVNLRLRGVVADIEVVPAIPVPDMVDDTRPCNIVAAKDAMISRITAKKGRAIVQAGDTVRAGDVLISGMVWDAGFTRMMFAARGKVIGSVWYAASAKAALHRQTQVPTGRSQTQRVIAIGADTAAVDGACTFALYQTRVIDTQYVVGLYLPVKLMVLEHTEMQMHQEPVDLQILRVYLEERAYYEAAASAQGDIVSHVTVFEELEGELTAVVYVQTYEDIGKVVYLEE